MIDLVGITPENEVLDAGSGIGGTARYVADRCRCRVTAVDTTEDYCETARWLNRLVGLHDQVSVRQADVTDLPYDDATFDVVLSQHVQMNVADKTRLYRKHAGCCAPVASSRSGTSPMVRGANSTIHSPGPTNPHSTT